MERNEPWGQIPLLKEHEATDDPAISGNIVSAQILDTLGLLKEGILIVGYDSRVTYANAEMARILSDHELAGKNIFEMNLEELIPEFLNYYKIATAEHKNVTLLEYIPPLRMWFNIYIYPAKAYVSVIFMDRSGIERLSELYKLTHYTIENAQEYVLWVGMDGGLAYVNEGTRSKLGYAMADHAQYRLSGILKTLPAAGWEEFRDDVKRRRSVTFESAVVDAYGKKITCEVTASHVKLKEREYIVVFIRDISQRKRTENELKASKAQAELYLDLMCHDINNINQVGLGFLELAMETEGLGEPARDCLDKTMESLQRSTSLINNVKKLQNSRNGSIQIRPIDLGAIVRKVVEQYSSQCSRDVSIQFKGAEVCNVMANDLLKDVFDNLIGNAIKHSQGPLAIDVVIDKAREGERDFYRVTIEDNGPGISDTVKNAIFDRGDVNRNRIAGKGLGLYLVKTLVSDFKGGVWVEDRVPGDYTKGCRFIVMLPAA